MNKDAESLSLLEFEIEAERNARIIRGMIVGLVATVAIFSAFIIFMVVN